MYDWIIIVLALMSMVLSFVLGFLVSVGDEKIVAHKSYLQGYKQGYQRGIRDGATTGQIFYGTESEEIPDGDPSAGQCDREEC